ncbi:S26 family signal peptidase [Paremcibacter congregatus]|uniref:S26 family signal peptidase n=1 Tax=Paremcibacter congregatus TaxID=2043170 RepID=UPI0030ECCCAE
MRFLIFIGFAFITVMVPMIVNLPIKLIYNASASAPIGFYRVTPVSGLKRGAFAVVPTPPDFRMIAAKRHYLPLNVPLIKRIIALSGDEVCRHGEAILVNKKSVATALTRDSQGRVLPVWQGCIILNEDQFFALMDRPDSFDGRYFGPLNTQDIIGIAVPVFTWKAEGSEIIAPGKEIQANKQKREN